MPTTSSTEIEPSCAHVPVEMFKQNQVWVNSKGIAEPIAKIADGHLDNIIKWIGLHSGHSHLNSWNIPVLDSPLMRALKAEQKKRIPKRATTPRAAIKDTLLNEVPVWPDSRATLHLDKAIDAFLRGLRKRGYDVTKIQEKK